MDLFNLFAKISLDATEFDSSVKNISKTSKTVENAINSLSTPVEKLQDSFFAFAHPIQTTKEGLNNVSNSLQKIIHPIDNLRSKISEASTNLETQRNKLSVLSSEYSSAQNRVSELTAAFNESARESGTSSAKTRELAKALEEAEKAAVSAKKDLERYANSIPTLSSKLKTAIQNVQNFATKVQSSMSKVGSIASKGFSGISSAVSGIGGAVTKGIGVFTGAIISAGAALLSLESSTEEYRTAMGKLNTAFESAGYYTKTANAVYKDFYKILGDTDRSVEASQLLAQLSENAADMSEWTHIAAGVWGTFGDSLPIEGLIESANETIKVGQVTGVLADALNWVGISEDEFNQKLAACSSETERNQLLMQTLSGAYNEASDAFYRNNEELVKARENQAALDEAMAKVGGSVTEIKNSFLETFMPSIASASESVAGFVGELNKSFSEDGLSGVIESGGTMVVKLVENIAKKLPDIIDSGVEILKSLMQGIKDKLPSLGESAATIISKLATSFLELLPDILDLGLRFILSLAKGIIQSIPELLSKIPKVIIGIVNVFKEHLPNILDIGKQIVEGLWEGVKAMANWIKEKITGFVGGIVDSVKGLLGIHSPSTVFAGMGKNMALGLGEGWDSEYSAIKKDIEKGMNFGTANVDFASSGLGIASAGIINGVSSGNTATQQFGNLSFNLVLPDGTKLATYMLPSLVSVANANGTPILNPS